MKPAMFQFPVLVILGKVRRDRDQDITSTYRSTGSCGSICFRTPMNVRSVSNSPVVFVSSGNWTMGSSRSRKRLVLVPGRYESSGVRIPQEVGTHVLFVYCSFTKQRVSFDNADQMCESTLRTRTAQSGDVVKSRAGSAEMIHGCEMCCSQSTTVNSRQPKLVSSAVVNCMAMCCGKSEEGSGLSCGMWRPRVCGSTKYRTDDNGSTLPLASLKPVVSSS